MVFLQIRSCGKKGDVDVLDWWSGGFPWRRREGNGLAWALREWRGRGEGTEA